MRKNIIKICLLIAASNILIISFDAGSSFAERVKIAVNTQHTIGRVNPLIFGSNVMGHKAASKKYKVRTRFSNYGGGIWNPLLSQTVPEVIALIKDAGIRNARFPGGTPGAKYRWKETIGDRRQRSDYLFGLDEFLKFCEEINAEVIYTLPYFTGTSQDAADLVEYLNAPDDGSNRGGGIDWARKRAENGHPQPYGVTLFELGNEVNVGISKWKIPGADAVTYARNYLEYKKRMTEIDPSILLGAVTVNSVSAYGMSAWSDKVFQIAGNSIDFLIEHTYRPNYFSNDEGVNANELMASTLRSLEDVEKYYKNLSKHFENITGRKDIPIAVTEYTGRFSQKRPVPFRYSLGAALFNAGLMQIFLKPENNILAASQIQIANDYWGMIRNDTFLDLEGHYIERPNFYVFEMFAKHFGNELLEVKIISFKELYDTTERSNLLSGIKWKVRPFSGADIEIKKDVVEILFDKENDINFLHVKKKVSVKPNSVYRLSAYIKAVDLQDHEGVYLVIMDGRGWNKTRSSAKTDRVWGTTEWVYVKTEYLTLSDAENALIMVRRRKGRSPIKGKVVVKDVRLTEISGSLKDKNAFSFTASRDKDGRKFYIMVLNKNVYEDMELTVVLSENELSEFADVWTLHGPYVWATNENKSDNVMINKTRIRIKSREANVAVPAHSLSSLEFTKK